MAGKGLIFLSLLCTLTSMILQIVVSVGAPTSNRISFLDVNLPNGVFYRFGPFGYTNIAKTSVGYYFKGFDTDHPHILYSFTVVLIFHPLLAGFLGLAQVLPFGALVLAHRRIGLWLLLVLAALTWGTALILWIIDMFLFGIVRNNYRDQGASANFANAEWISLASMCLSFFATLFALVAIVGHYSRGRKRAEAEAARAAKTTSRSVSGSEKS